MRSIRLLPKAHLITQRLHITPLGRKGALGVVLGLPSRRTNVRDTIGILKNVLDLFEGLTRGLGEEEEDVEEHGRQEHTEYDVSLPADAGEGDGDEEA